MIGRNYCKTLFEFTINSVTYVCNVRKVFRCSFVLKKDCQYNFNSDDVITIDSK